MSNPPATEGAEYVCEYAGPGRSRCPSWRCDCFVATHPDSPSDLHPEAFRVVDQAG